MVGLKTIQELSDSGGEARNYARRHQPKEPLSVPWTKMNRTQRAGPTLNFTLRPGLQQGSPHLKRALQINPCVHQENPTPSRASYHMRFLRLSNAPNFLMA